MIVEKIRTKCSEKGLSLTELEQAVGLGNGVIGKWRDRSPNLSSIKRIADYFGCTIDDLLKED